MTTTPGDEGQPPDPYQPPPGPEHGSWEQQAPQQPGPYDQPAHDQPAYGQPSGYYAPPGGGYAPDHPKATTSLVLGILGVVLCQVLAPFAWVIGRRTVKEIDDSHGQLGGRGSAQAGYVMGIIGTILLALALLFVLFMFVVVVIFANTSGSTTF